jgi:hypothetical protein
MRNRTVLLNGKRIHIRPQPDHLARITSLSANHTNNPCFPYATMDFNTQGLKRTRHDPRGTYLLKSKLGIGVQITPQRDEFLMEFLY